MELIRGLHNLSARHRGCVATIGAFDGLHSGHQAVLGRLIERGGQLGLPSTVIVFEPLPREFFAPDKAPARLMNFREKFCLLRKLGIDRVLRIPFGKRLASMPANDFIRQVIVDGLGIQFLVVGDDLRFGRGREGDFHTLQQAGDRFGFDVVDTDTLNFDGNRVSSTRIREALAQDDFELAERLLGRPYSMCGRVVRGSQLGRQLGVPTANLALRRTRSAMAGVYVVEVKGREGKLQPAVANVGTRPTINDSSVAVLEVHLLEFEGDLYGEILEVIFRKKVRDEKKFDSVEQLKSNIENDIIFAKKYFGLIGEEKTDKANKRQGR
jgi:riboflavin kinase/FMN adenylyltransferase